MTNVIIQPDSVETERNILMESYNSNNDRPKISLNRKKRMWNRYRNYVIGLIILVVAIIIFAVVLKSCSGKNGGKDDNKSTTAPVKQESTQGVQDETQRSDNSSQEMWFNYRKPRPCKRGAYLYAVKFNVPVISLFVEQQVKSTHLHTFRVHVMPVIYPDRQLDERTASLRMQHTDYEQKCAAYVMAYGKKLTYDFEEGDIVGR